MEEKPKQGFDSYAFLTWLEVNKARLIIAAIILATAALLVALAAWKRDRDEAAAGRALLELQLAHQDAAATAPPPEAYVSVARQYPRTAAGVYARLLAGQTHFAEGNYEQAQSQFQHYIDEHPDGPLAPEALLGVAASLDARRLNAEAIERYREVVTRFPQTAAASQARLSLARLLELENQPAASLRLYDELLRAEDGWTGEARERRRQLLLDYPELRPAPAPEPAPEAPVAEPQEPSPAQPEQ